MHLCTYIYFFSIDNLHSSNETQDLQFPSSGRGKADSQQFTEEVPLKAQPAEEPGVPWR